MFRGPVLPGVAVVVPSIDIEVLYEGVAIRIGQGVAGPGMGKLVECRLLVETAHVAGVGVVELDADVAIKVEQRFMEHEIDAVALDDGRVFARDWMTGKFATTATS